MEATGPGSILIERLLAESDKKGFLPAAVIERVSRDLAIPASRVYAVAGQLEHFRFDPGPKGATAVCRGPACELAGSWKLMGSLEAAPDVEPVPLLGSPFWHAPILAVVPGRGGAGISRKVEAAATSLEELAGSPSATSMEPATDLFSGKKGLLYGLGSRRSVAAYLKSDADKFARFMAGNSPAEVLQLIRASRLVDTMTGHEVADIIDSRLASPETGGMVVCDTGGLEPENNTAPVLAWIDPMGVIEGILLAAHTAGAERALIFVPHEHARLRELMERALEGVAREGLWPAVEIEMFSGPNLIPTDREIGIASLYRGLTLSEGASRASESMVRLWGAGAFFSDTEVFLRLSRLTRAREKAPSTRVISVGGCVNSPCVTEAALTGSAGDLVAESAGGLVEGSVLKAIHFGGVFGGPLRPVALNSRLRSLFGRFDGGGSGHLLLIDTGTCMVRWSEYFAWLGERLCCGACVAGRLGPSYVRRLLGKITAGRGESADLEEILATIDLMKQTSLCAQGGKVLNAVAVALEGFSGEFEEHITEKKCRAGVCWPPA